MVLLVMSDQLNTPRTGSGQENQRAAPYNYASFALEGVYQRLTLQEQIRFDTIRHRIESHPLVIQASHLFNESRAMLARLHSEDVALFCMVLGIRLQAGDEEVEAMGVAGYIHDLGKAKWGSQPAYAGRESIMLPV